MSHLYTITVNASKNLAIVAPLDEFDGTIDNTVRYDLSAHGAMVLIGHLRDRGYRIVKLWTVR